MRGARRRDGDQLTPDLGPRVDPTRGSVRRAVLRLAGPTVAATVLQTVFNITDTFWVGRQLGPDALAGVSTAGFAVWALLALAEVTAVGLTAVASRRHGEARHEDAARAVHGAFWLALVLSTAVGLTGLWLLGPLFELMGTPSAVTAQGSGYLAVYLAGVPLVFCFFVMNAAYRSAGDTRTPFRLLALAVILNILLDPVLILGLGPAPRLGIQGAALATLATRGIALGVGARGLARRGLVRPERLTLRGRLRQFRAIVRIGLPVGLGGATFSLVYVLLTRITSRFGTPALAALGVGHKVESLSYMVCVGFGLAAATAVGQNLGAGRPERATASGRLATGFALAVTAAAGLLFFLAPSSLIGVFTRDPAVIHAGASYLRIVAVAQLFMALEIVLESAMDGAGYTLVPTTVSMTLTVLRLPIAYALSAVIGLVGVWWAISSTAVARGALVAWIWRRGRWRARAV